MPTTEEEMRLVQEAMSPAFETVGNEYSRFAPTGDEFKDRVYNWDNVHYESGRGDGAFFDKFTKTAPPYQKGMLQSEYAAILERHWENLQGMPFPGTDGTINALLAATQALMRRGGGKPGSGNYGHAGQGPNAKQQREIGRGAHKPLGPEFYPED